MKVDKIISSAIKDVSSNSSKKSASIVENSIREFNDRAGDISGRCKVLCDKAEDITAQELAGIKDYLRKKMTERNFAQSTIDYILSYTNKYSWRAAIAMVEDEYAHTSDIRWAIGYTTKNNAALMEDAAKKKNYRAFYSIGSSRSGGITDKSQIKDMREEVIKNERVYKPQKVNTPVVSDAVFNTQRQEVLNIMKQNGANDYTIKYIENQLNIENIEVAKILAEDINAADMVRDHNGYMRWVVGYTNAENAELMLRAALHKQYDSVYAIQGGRIRNLDTLDAIQAFRQRIAKGLSANNSKENINNVGSFARSDEYSDFMKIMLEDEAVSFDFIAKVTSYLNQSNKEALKKAFINRDFAEMERICGVKFNPSDVDVVKEKIKYEYNTTSQSGKITRADFVRYMDNKLKSVDKLNVSVLKDSEIRNLAKLFGTAEEQIMNMDKKEYRRLCIKTHPDRNPNDNLSTQIFRILNRIYNG